MSLLSCYKSQTIENFVYYAYNLQRKDTLNITAVFKKTGNSKGFLDIFSLEDDSLILHGRILLDTFLEEGVYKCKVMLQKSGFTTPVYFGKLLKAKKLCIDFKKAFKKVSGLKEKSLFAYDSERGYIIIRGVKDKKKRGIMVEEEVYYWIFDKDLNVIRRVKTVERKLEEK